VSSDQLQHSGLAGLLPEQQAAVRRIYTEALRDDMTVCCALLGLGLLCSVFIYRKGRLSPEEMQKGRHNVEKDRIAEGVAAGAGAGEASGVAKADV